MKYMRILSVLWLAILTILIACDSMQKNLELAKKAQLPVYKGAKKVRYVSSNNDMVKSIAYEVKIPYPAKDLINFYSEEMAKLGYQPFVEEYYKYASKDWQHYEDGTIKGNPSVAQFNSDWIDEKRTKRATLLLKIYTYQSTLPNVDDFQEDLKVHFQVSPFFVLPPPESVS